MKRASVQEIFSSIQGEGPWIGERHIFVRFLGCGIQCRYCDTLAASCDSNGPLNKLCNVQQAPGSDCFEHVPNPVAAADLTKFCSRLAIPGPSRPTISLTGGEPLLQSDFLMEWLPQIQGAFRVYLETNGLHARAMQELRDSIDVVSMDFKLPSATGLRPFWEEHKEFMRAARGKTLIVKAVITHDTTMGDVLTAAQTIAEFDATILLVLQPAWGPLAPPAGLLMKFQDAALGLIQDVRVIPQAHKILNVP